MANRLANSTSPYLLQHQDNPVDWFEWGDDAFAEAARRKVPVLLSVGYAACHWCHVMAHESFEDDAVAATMNEHFVNIKVDREERPDVDATYMSAVQAMTGQGGWPMTAFLTPTGEPFYAGTYFPPRPSHGRPSFAQVLAAVSDTWQDRQDETTAAAQRIASHLAQSRPSSFGDAGPATAESLAAAVRALVPDFDSASGGFGTSPKFPPSVVLEFLIRHHLRTGDPAALAMAEATCEHMARGGIYDQLAGGFARYSVDAHWVVPHFEKMLYDNAQLLRIYLHLWQTTGSDLARRVVVETAEFLLTDLLTPEGGFASALDADTDGVEGATYAWTPSQVRDALAGSSPDDADWAVRLLHVTDAGTFEHGASTLQLLEDPGVASGDDGWARWQRIRDQLLAARSQRRQPARDDKVVAAWNGLAISALAESGLLLQRPDWVDAALAAADLLVRVHLDEHGRLARTSRDGAVGTAHGVLEDYACVAESFLTLTAVTGEGAWLSLAGGLLEVILTRFGDGGGGFFDTADDAGDVRLQAMGRPQDFTDNVTPSGWHAAADALLRYAGLTGSSRHREAAVAALGATARVAERAPRAVGWGLAASEALVSGPREVAVVGAEKDGARAELHRAALRPGVVVAVGDPDDPASADIPLLLDRPLLNGAAAAYVCTAMVCKAPVSTSEALLDGLR